MNQIPIEKFFEQFGRVCMERDLLVQTNQKLENQLKVKMDEEQARQGEEKKDTKKIKEKEKIISPDHKS